ncbi:UDP-N-acetylmuramoylalanine--D-glutamate ligase [Candidatus Daviesbacteria bacterium RIFCSPHIGHO2_02_FULL_36_13]|uniref:UDP-N-acetylmuramoylalanine--D-glutamate ligase n=1 Tax=Candidatus Daviesbacteria bacterium RIFCSPHIGHO2_02_FULL_36_13 TaxID=1797768 RepID=A0A1F5JQ62_9BACT|nr:MAG: UDP-N-acetylmuramoylalanine--D-glutamate ligase [Candidatus Daviesbacteria bacterium RIFCSPHIGHO2_02_FULL_36_13]
MYSFKGKKVLVFGLGLNQGGVGSAKFFANAGAEVRITDLKSKSILQPSIDQLKSFPNISYTLGEHKNEDIDWADLIIKNPSVKRDNPYLDHARRKNKDIETDLGIFFKLVDKSKIIGVTGTKGKSTTASLIYAGLKENNQDVVLAGNIGRSVLDCIPLVKENTLVVLEISSFQLEGLAPLRVSPKYAVVTNIFPDHLNVYKDMFEYISAKRLITQFQSSSDFLFLNKDDKTLNNPKFTSGLSAKIIFYSKQDLPKDFKPNLIGEHNLENIAAAFAVSKAFNIDENQMLQSLSSFKGVPFRMELTGQWNGIKIINDTTATGPDAGIQALNSYPNSIVIAGGMNKNMPYEGYVKVLEENAKEVFFLEGDSADLIMSSLRKPKARRVAERSNLKTHGPYSDLEKLLEDIKKIAKEGDTILFSPAATSYNLFQNEFDRGRRFNKAVEKVFGEDIS